MRLIDGDALYKAMQDAEELARRRVRDTESTLPYHTNLNPAYTRYLAQMDERTKAKHMIADAPTVDAVPVRHGHWVRHDYADIVDGHYVPNYECSVCHAWKQDDSDYCPDCGALNDGNDGDNG